MCVRVMLQWPLATMCVEECVCVVKRVGLT